MTSCDILLNLIVFGIVFGIVFFAGYGFSAWYNERREK